MTKNPIPATTRDKLLYDLSRVLTGKPIDEVAPVLVVAVARVLVMDADNDAQKLALNVAKFMNRLTDTINDMMMGDPEETVH